MKKHVLPAITAALLMNGFAAAQDAADYPDRPVRIVVPSTAGGPGDVFARHVASELQEAWGQPVIVETRPGAIGVVGLSYVAQQPADGYTLVWSFGSGHVISPLFLDPKPFDPIESFEPISHMFSLPFVLIANPAIPAENLTEFIEYARERDGELNYASFGTNSGGHLMTVLFNNRTGINAEQVAYQGIPEVHQALISGEADYAVDSPGASRDHIEAGRLKAFGVSTPERSSAVPDVPSLHEFGFTEFNHEIWHGVLAPAGTPKEIVDKISSELVAIVDRPGFQELAATFGYRPVGSDPETFREMMIQDIANWSEVADSMR